MEGTIKISLKDFNDLNLKCEILAKEKHELKEMLDKKCDFIVKKSMYLYQFSSTKEKVEYEFNSKDETVKEFEKIINQLKAQNELNEIELIKYEQKSNDLHKVKSHLIYKIYKLLK